MPLGCFAQQGVGSVRTSVVRHPRVVRRMLPGCWAASARPKRMLPGRWAASASASGQHPPDRSGCCPDVGQHPPGRWAASARTLGSIRPASARYLPASARLPPSVGRMLRGSRAASARKPGSIRAEAGQHPPRQGGCCRGCCADAGRMLPGFIWISRRLHLDLVNRRVQWHEARALRRAEAASGHWRSRQPRRPSRGDRRGRELGGGSPGGSCVRGAAAGVTEGISRAARKAERPSELVAPRPAHRWPRGAAAPRILARHTSAPQRPARGDRQLLGPAESRGNGAGARLGPHRVRGHRCGRLKSVGRMLCGCCLGKTDAGRLPGSIRFAEAASAQHPPDRADAARTPSGCCPDAKRMLPGRQADAGADAAWVRADAARSLGGCCGSIRAASARPHHSETEPENARICRHFNILRRSLQP